MRTASGTSSRMVFTLTLAVLFFAAGSLMEAAEPEVHRYIIPLFDIAKVCLYSGTLVDSRFATAVDVYGVFWRNYEYVVRT